MLNKHRIANINRQDPGTVRPVQTLHGWCVVRGEPGRAVVLRRCVDEADAYRWAGLLAAQKGGQSCR